MLKKETVGAQLKVQEEHFGFKVLKSEGTLLMKNLSNLQRQKIPKVIPIKRENRNENKLKTSKNPIFEKNVEYFLSGKNRSAEKPKMRTA